MTNSIWMTSLAKIIVREGAKACCCVSKARLNPTLDKISSSLVFAMASGLCLTVITRPRKVKAPWCL